MIIRSRFRRAGGLSAHLLRTDTNEEVQVVTECCRDAPTDVFEALKLFTAISRTNPRAKRDLIHIKVSPDHSLSVDEIDASLSAIEREHCIPGTMPRIMVRHRKGGRADHFHVVYPLIDPVTGKAVRSDGNYLRDELVSRVLEHQFDERVIAGKHHEEVVNLLRARGIELAAPSNDVQPQPERGSRIDGGTRQQAERLGVDLKRIQLAVLSAWRAHGHDRAAFENALAAHSLELAQGTKALVVVDLKTGWCGPVARMLRQTEKEISGTRMKVREQDLREKFPGLDAYEVVRDRGLKGCATAVEAGVDDEAEKLAAEAIIDGQTRHADRLAAWDRARREARKQAFSATLKARREAIRRDIALRDRLRQHRIARAFRIARITSDKNVLMLVQVAAAAGWVMAGGWIGVALVVGGMAAAVLPDFERARAIKRMAEMERQDDLLEMKQRLEAAFGELKSEMAATDRGKPEAQDTKDTEKPRRSRVRRRIHDGGTGR